QHQLVALQREPDRLLLCIGIDLTGLVIAWLVGKFVDVGIGISHFHASATVWKIDLLDTLHRDTLTIAFGVFLGLLLVWNNLAKRSHRIVGVSRCSWRCGRHRA